MLETAASLLDQTFPPSLFVGKEMLIYFLKWIEVLKIFFKLKKKINTFIINEIPKMQNKTKTNKNDQHQVKWEQQQSSYSEN